MSKANLLSLEQIIDVSEENNSQMKESLEKISEKEKAVVLAFIAPYIGRQFSPQK